MIEHTLQIRKQEPDYVCVCPRCQRVVVWQAGWLEAGAKLARTHEKWARERLHVLRMTTEEARKESDRRGWGCSCGPKTTQGRLF